MADALIYQLDSPEHVRWLAAESSRLIDFAAAAVNPGGGFSWLRIDGSPDPVRRLPLYAASRFVHCFGVEHLLGRAGAGEVAAHGITELSTALADREFGGFFARVPESRSDAASVRKDAYGHSFALLAGVTGMRAGLAEAEVVFDRARSALDTRFWDDRFGASRESFSRDFSDSELYRGQNSNMHLTEACLAAFEATGDEVFVQRAELVAQRLIQREAATHSWRVPEHFTSDWVVDPRYNRDRPTDPFRPYGTLVGHSLEWARLLLQLRALRPTAEWALPAAKSLFARAIADGWDAGSGGFLYSVDEHGAPINRSRMHWAAAEAVGAALWLYRATGEREYRDWYATFWSWIDSNLIDRGGGSWWHELDELNRPAATTWDGKPDLYHAWQATLYSRADGTLGLGEAASRGQIAVPASDR